MRRLYERGGVRWGCVHETSRFRADVEGLRAAAVVAVVAYHAGLGGVGGGFVGVDVFYVLSGFLITGLLWEELDGTGRLRLGAFYARRARRLLPAAALVLVVTLVASAVWLSPLQVPVVARDAAAAALYVANYRFAAQRTDYLADASPSPLQHYWSLGVEEQFYLLWPLLLLVVFLAARRGRRSATRAAGAAVSQPWAFFSLPTRAWELAAGGLVALAASRLARLPGLAAATLGWLGLEAILWSITRFGPSTPFPGAAALFPVAGTAAVLAAGCAAPRLGPDLVLRRWPLQLGGRLSYAWYLWHWPLLVLAPAVVGHPPEPGAKARSGRRRRPARRGNGPAGGEPGPVLGPTGGAAESEPDPGGGPDHDRRGGRHRDGESVPSPPGPRRRRSPGHYPHRPAGPEQEHQAAAGPGRGPAGQAVRTGPGSGGQGGAGAHGTGQSRPITGIGPRRPAPPRRRRLPDPLAGCVQRFLPLRGGRRPQDRGAVR